MEQIRSFVAIELPDELKRKLTHLQAQLKTGKEAPVKWVAPNGIHLTLKFLGNTAADKIKEITGAIEVSAEGIPPFHLEVKELGAFPNLRRVQVVWVGITGEVAQLSELQQRIEANLALLGFAPESRPFTPHLTLARVRQGTSPEEQQSFGQLIASTGFDAACDFSVDAVSLMKSELTREGAIYSRIGLIGLKH